MVQAANAWTCCPNCGRNEITIFNGHSCKSCGYELPDWMRAEFPLRNIEAERVALERQAHTLHVSVLPPVERMDRLNAIEKMLALGRAGT